MTFTVYLAGTTASSAVPACRAMSQRIITYEACTVHQPEILRASQIARPGTLVLVHEQPAIQRQELTQW